MNQSRKNFQNQQSGFTLVELMLAMAFLSLLLLAIAMTIMQIANIYNRGATVRQINQASRTLTEDIKRIASESAPFKVDDNLIRNDTNSNLEESKRAGRLCVGGYAYIWNTPDSSDNLYEDGSKVKFARVNSNGGTLCQNTTSRISPTAAVELLKFSDRNLMVHQFSIEQLTTPADMASYKEAVYSLKLLIGPENKALVSSSSNCKPPSDNQSDFTYCAINEIEFTIKSGEAL